MTGTGGPEGGVTCCCPELKSSSLCAGPAAVSHLAVTSANSSSLSFSWQPSDGHVDIYNVSLFSVTEVAAKQGQDAAGGRRQHHQVGSLFTPVVKNKYLTHL